MIVAYILVEAGMDCYADDAWSRALSVAGREGLLGSIVREGYVPDGTPVSPDVVRHTLGCAGLPSWSYSFAVVA